MPEWHLCRRCQKARIFINSQRNIDTRWVFNVAPYLRFRYKFSKTRNMNVD